MGVIENRIRPALKACNQGNERSQPFSLIARRKRDSPKTVTLTYDAKTKREFHKVHQLK